MLDRIPPRQKAGILVAIALLLWAPTGISEESLPMVTGHSVFFNGDVYDQCLASIAGIMRSRVMWFNDMVLAERYAGKGTYIYITQAGAPDPTTQTLYSEGTSFQFTDPNGARWHVHEAFMLLEYDVASTWPDIDTNPFDGGINTPDVRWSSGRIYTWYVELAERPITDQFAGDPNGPYYHDLYNFLLMVDTCKMKKEATSAHNQTHDWDDLDTIGHPTNATPHEHEVHNVNLWVGKRPTVLTASTSPAVASWQSAWATASTRNATAGP